MDSKTNFYYEPPLVSTSPLDATAAGRLTRVSFPDLIPTHQRDAAAITVPIRSPVRSSGPIDERD